MINSIDQYLSSLKKNLAGCDRATIQDALSDAEGHLRTALNNVTSKSCISEVDALPEIIEKYGTPEEIAVAYRDLENLLPATLEQVGHPKEPNIAEEPVQPDGRSLLSRFFGVFIDHRTWGALLYLLFSLCTGIFYFTWVTTGISVSLGFLILIIGLPFAGLFLLSVRGIALLEGRIIEALLEIRMPRRPLFNKKNIGWWAQFKILITEKRTWITMVYMIIQLPAGIIYFTISVFLLALSLGLIAQPFLELAFKEPFLILNNMAYDTPIWLMPIIIIVGLVLLTLTMHLVRFLAQKHGIIAKAMLVRA